MTRKRTLIALIAVLSLALSAVVIDIATGFITGDSRSAADAGGAPSGASSPPSAPGAGEVPETPADAPDIAVQPDEQARFIGSSNDGGFSVAVMVWKSKAIAYVSDGSAQEAWLSGTAGGDTLLLTGADGAVLHASVTDGALTGTAAWGQFEIAFTLPAAQPPAGLYHASAVVDGSQVRIGLIVMPDSSQTGIEWVDGVPQAAPAWDLEGATVPYRGTELQVKAIRPADA
ncbi:hypothetical protein ACFQ6S_42145 [Streptomyces sp. NPDC056479]|uniref:hypothetical protein n=1 Tax=Streptomyces sp. NPDC056479 TaxID=3345832 RepID=UPI00369F955B